MTSRLSSAAQTLRPVSWPAAPAVGSRASLQARALTWPGSRQSPTRSSPPPAAGNFGALLETLDPGAVVRSNGTEVVRGAAVVAGRAFPFTRTAKVILPAVINGGAGLVTATDGRPVTLVGFTITDSKITAIDLIDDPRRIAEADLAILAH